MSIKKGILKFIIRRIYNKKYLSGKYFENSFEGYVWCWRNLVSQKVFGFNKHVPWPVNPSSVVGNPNNISFDNDDLIIFQQIGCYFQCWDGKITIGQGTYVAQNVGIITANHDPEDLDMHLKSKDVVIGKKCWVGMNSVLLPGVKLGDQTIVGAGSVVTKSFEEGRCVIAGNPARILKVF